MISHEKADEILSSINDVTLIITNNLENKFCSFKHAQLPLIVVLNKSNITIYYKGNIIYTYKSSIFRLFQSRYSSIEFHFRRFCSLSRVHNSLSLKEVNKTKFGDNYDRNNSII